MANQSSWSDKANRLIAQWYAGSLAKAKEGGVQDHEEDMSERALLSRLRGPIRLRTLTTLRWLAVFGQTITILLVHFGFGFQVPLGICLGVIAASAWLNIFVMLRFPPQRILGDDEAARHMGFDIFQLCALLFFTGGLQNPFATLILAPATIAASVLPLRQTLIVGALALTTCLNRNGGIGFGLHAFAVGRGTCVCNSSNLYRRCLGRSFFFCGVLLCLCSSHCC